MDCASKQKTCMPLLILMGVKPLLSPAETRLARLVCREWAAEFAAAVDSIQLPPELWQITTDQQQAVQLKRLVSTYWSFQHANLLADSSQQVCTEALQLAVQTLGTIAALRSIAVCKLGSSTNSINSSSNWAALLQGLAGLPDSVANLDLRHIRLPGPEGLNKLSGLHNIHSLTIQSSNSSKLQQEHIVAIAGMHQLTSLKLSFRVVNGSRVQPLTLDCLGQLSKLQKLEIKYTGMPELASGVCFAGDDLLPGCSSLTSLLLKRIPTPSLRGLFRQQQLRQLVLLQLCPLTENQARSLGLCTQLESLGLDNVPLELVPRLAALTNLSGLQLSLWDPHANAGADLPGGPNLLSLSSLKKLRTISLSGPVLLCREDILSLAAGWQGLTSLSLAATLGDGSQGLSGFSSLEVLRLRPWQGSVNRAVGDAGLGGDEDGPLLSGTRCVFVSEHDLPESLKELEGWQLVFVPGALTSAATPGDQPGMQGGESILQIAGSILRNTSGGHAVKALHTLKLRHSPDGVLGNSAPQLAGWHLMQGLIHLELQHPLLTSQQLAAAVAACGSSLTTLTINTADVSSQFRTPVAAEACSAAALLPVGGAAAPALSCSQSNTRRTSSSGGKPGHSTIFGSHSRRTSSSSSNAMGALSLLSGAAAAAVAAAATGQVATAAGMPQLGGMAVATVAATAGIATAGAAAGALSRSSSMSLWSTGGATLANLMTEALSGLTCTGSATAAGFSSMGQQLGENMGLAVLAQCSALKELSLVVGDRALGARSWAALATLPKLSKLTLAVASDMPAAAARDVALGVASMKGLTWVGLGLEGPGSGDAVSMLVDRVAAALPVCQVHVLRGSRV